MSASNFRQQARERLNGAWGTAVGATFVAGLLGAAGSSSSTATFNFGFNEGQMEAILGQEGQGIIGVIDFFNEHPGLVTFMLIVSILATAWGLTTFITGGATKLGLIAFNRKLYRGEAPIFKDIFTHYDIFWKGFLANFLTNLFISLWTLLFIIPGVIAHYAYAMTFYILDENPDMSVMDAITESRRIMKGHKWELFCLRLSFIGWSILAVFTFGIGALFLVPYENQAEYAFYHALVHGGDMPQNEFGYVSNDVSAVNVTEPAGIPSESTDVPIDAPTENNE